MIELNKKIELLAPAKDKICAFAAINAGADAVYIGADSFGARKKAGNSLADIEEIVRYAHKFLVKVYVTVNTILYDSELDAVEKLIWNLYNIGVDAVIFQDFAFFEMNLPPIALHASTQCNNDSIEKIKFLKEMNVQRVVLPREFSLNEIKNVTKNIDIETEVFVHGALCVCYSGQCYLSNCIGGRSANRGECAQPCRKKYSLIDDKGNVILKEQYLLSMKDNNLSAYLSDLVNAGVTSLKIEGRLKDADYVTNVVSFYRKELNKLAKDIMPSKGLIESAFMPNPDKTFNRGYTNFYFDAQRKIFINPATPKFTGEKIGTVKSISGKKIKINFATELNVSDKITYFDKNGELFGTTISRVSKDLIEVLNPGLLSKGVVLYRNFDSEFYNSLKKAQFKRKVPVSIYVDNNKINIKSFGCNEINYNFEESFEIAKNPDKAKETIVKQMSKLGDTEFNAVNISVADDFNLFIPVSKINDIRRRAITLLQDISKNNYEFQRRQKSDSIVQYPFKELDYSFNISNKKAKAFYEKCGSRVIEYSPEITNRKNNINLMKTKHCLRYYCGKCLKKQSDSAKLFLADGYGVKYPLYFDCSKCVMYVKGV